MFDFAQTDRTVRVEWVAYGIRDAIVFVAGVVLALTFVLPFV